jgi:outer membrane protein OmpA-like peptidoglycan-associated protein
MLFVSMCSLIEAQEEDAEGCKDNPMFSRMPNYFLGSCDLKEFDAFKFTVENNWEEDAKTETIEGKYSYYYYDLKEGATEPSALQIFRNFENAIIKMKSATIVGKVVEPGNSYSFICAKIANGDKETWVRIEVSHPDYILIFVEREAMVQVIQANEMLDALNTNGFISLDILFDTGKATIKSESMEIVEQIYVLLNENADLKVSIEGHTDNTGTPAGNKTLSENRAKSVMDALIVKGINKSRLSSKGFGQENPVADNRNEEGKAKNRRVEIVKK